MIGELLLDHFHHRIPNGPNATLVQEVAHIDGGTVEEQPAEISIVHQVTEQTGMLTTIGPVCTGIIVLVVNPGNGIVIGRMAIKTETEVGIFGNKTPTATLGTRSPKDGVIAWEIAVAIVEVHNHQISKLGAVHPLLILG